MHKMPLAFIALLAITLTVTPMAFAAAPNDHAPAATGWASSLVEWFKAALTDQGNNGGGNKPGAYTVAKTDEDNDADGKPETRTAAKTTDEDDAGGNNKPGA